MRVIFGVLTFAVAAAFVSLGLWQWQRGELRQVQYEQFQRGSEQALPLGSRGLDEVERSTRVRLMGRYEPDRQFLLDNRTYQGRAGYEVLTPFRREDGRVVLVNRGWVPFRGFREQLPEIGFEADVGEVTGRVDELPSAGLASGRAPPEPGESWPKVTSYPEPGELAEALGEQIESRILLLDPQAPHGYVRDWQPPGLTPAQHRSYAFQWWALATAVIAIWLVVSIRSKRHRA